MSTARKPPWKKANPKAKSGQSRHLTSAQKANAKQAAKRAGRKYPNLVDNMRAAKTSRNTAKRPQQ
jgi:hypothetical protein